MRAQHHKVKSAKTFHEKAEKLFAKLDESVNALKAASTQAQLTTLKKEMAEQKRMVVEQSKIIAKLAEMIVGLKDSQEKNAQQLMIAMVSLIMANKPKKQKTPGCSHSDVFSNFVNSTNSSFFEKHSSNSGNDEWIASHYHKKLTP